MHSTLKARLLNLASFLYNLLSISLPVETRISALVLLVSCSSFFLLVSEPIFPPLLFEMGKLQDVECCFGVAASYRRKRRRRKERSDGLTKGMSKFPQSSRPPLPPPPNLSPRLRLSSCSRVACCSPTIMERFGVELLLNVQGDHKY